ncbi:MAG: hypothetical protein CSA54_06100 [Gammaproteobacteria bacterium]|nr:MAG: hypothetical protein CSA54_06100 [Gammaproteobacteria bacterium]
MRQIVFLTDGSVGYEDQIIRAIAKSIGDQRLFAVGIGSAPNRWFIEQAALVGGGAALSIRDAADAQDALTRLLDTLSRPALTDIEIEWTGADAEMHPNRIPDLYADNPMLLLAKLDPSTTGLRISGSLQGESWEKEVRFDATAMPSGDDDVSPSLADSSTIPSTTSSMASSKTPGTAPGATPGTASTSGAQAGSDTTMMSATGLLWNRFAMRTLLNEQRLSSDPELHKEAITEIALSAGLVSPYTSYIAVEQQPVRPADASLGQSEVVNRMPAGNQMQSVMLPQGSAGSDTLKWLALISAIIGFALLYMSSLSVYARNERPTA